MMMLLVALALLGMLAIYSLIAYFLIRIISKKAFKVTLTKLEIMETITWLALIFVAFSTIRSGSSSTFLPSVLLLVPLINMRISNRKERERLKRECT
ncbi:hypothetical protein PAECIP112173_00603 [Paenibacillus sp. JJ-100]|uniref:hypothetical protein n=1 Tax=Paenibacillus sp. JJ-100 TaxID=2974896 RepID=UPI0022FF7245|nr:hypothetical protein [Paenibacillus sp. JJ-100]CAI6030174.1 hypothetical protein PAECIP112173_00603 [Paenibacillus sp. JJ-100]